MLCQFTGFYHNGGEEGGAEGSGKPNLKPMKLSQDEATGLALSAALSENERLRAVVARHKEEIKRMKTESAGYTKQIEELIMENSTLQMKLDGTYEEEEGDAAMEGNEESPTEGKEEGAAAGESPAGTPAPAQPKTQLDYIKRIKELELEVRSLKEAANGDSYMEDSEEEGGEEDTAEGSGSMVSSLASQLQQVMTELKQKEVRHPIVH